MTKTVIDTDEILDLDEAAKELGIGIATLFRWMEKGKIIPFRWSRRTYIPRSEIERIKRENHDEN